MRTFRSICAVFLLTPCFPFLQVSAQQPFLTPPLWTTLRDESNGAVAYENLRYLTTLHRVAATAQFDEAANFILQRAREYGLADAHSEQFPIDGTKSYGLMRSYPFVSATGSNPSHFTTTPSTLVTQRFA